MKTQFAEQVAQFRHKAEVTYGKSMRAEALEASLEFIENNERNGLFEPYQEFTEINVGGHDVLVSTHKLMALLTEQINEELKD